MLKSCNELSIPNRVIDNPSNAKANKQLGPLLGPLSLFRFFFWMREGHCRNWIELNQSRWNGIEVFQSN